MSDFITELKERRVLPAVGVYVASCWVVVEILDRLSERYLLSPYLTDIVFWGLYSLIPAVVLVAWSYGRPGKDKATKAQKVGVPINIIATTGLLITLFGGKDLGNTADRITLANEDGVQETHIVPKKTYRKRLAVFFYANNSGDPELDWLQYGATELLTQDLQQDPFMLAYSPWVGWGAGYYGRMRAAGYEDGLGVPRSLLRDIASDANRDHFTEGSIDRDGDELVITTRVWETASMQQVVEITERGWDIYSLQDETSQQVREALGIPSVDLAGHEDLPLADTYGESEEAFKLYLAGLNLRLFTGDVAAANAKLDEALAEDPNFVLAHFVKGLNLAESGDLPGAALVFQEAQKMDYRLPSSDRATLKAMLYRTSGQTDKLIDFLNLQVRLRDDAQTHAQLANILMVAGDTEGAKQHFTTALERDANMVSTNLMLSVLERSTGNMDAAIAYAKTYAEARPEDMDASLQLGDLLRDTGELDQANDYYRQAQLIESDTVSPILRQRIIAARRGDEAGARELLEEAAVNAETSVQMSQLHSSASYFEARLGRIRAAIEQLQAAEPHIAQTQAPFVVALAIYAPQVGMYSKLGELETARSIQAKAEAGMQPPLNEFLGVSEATLLAYEGDFDGAEAALDRVVAVMEQLKFDGLRFQVEIARADVLARKGDYAAAEASMATGLEEADTSFVAAELHAHVLPALYGALAEYRVNLGDFEGAEQALETGFRLDPNLPQLWAARALLQKESGKPQLAVASVNYALALWENADPEFEDLRKTLALAADLKLAAN